MMAATADSPGDGEIVPEFVADFVAWLHLNEPDQGAVLVFLSGFQDIKVVHEILERRGLPGARLIPLHGSMPTVSQREIFQRPPPGTRKIVLATNIAETSITIDDVTVVVDCGIHKVMSYDSLNEIRELSPHWCGPNP
jgi:ATP-dependent RNA helicase DHX36